MKLQKIAALLLLPCVLLLWAASPALKQFGPIEELIELLNKQATKYIEEYPQEKVYLHIDKPHYVAGENIWYKAYLTAGSYNQPSPLSKNLYVELVDESGQMPIEQLIKIDSGFAYGDFSLPEGLPQGNYQLRAYTNWMRNYDTDYIFTKNIFVQNADTAQAAASTITSLDANKIDLQFFPEGGQMVSGIPIVVAFKAVDATGKGTPVSGRILDQERNTVASFESFHLGMGAFSLLPQAGTSYTAEVTLLNGKTERYPLPTVVNSGIVMSLQNTATDFIRVILQGNLAEPIEEVLLIGHARGAVELVAKADMRNNAFAVNIPRDTFSDGIIHITAFAPSGEALAERLFFNTTRRTLNISLSTNKQNYGKREAVDLSVEITTANGDPASANLSLVAIDTAKVQGGEPYAADIRSYLLLTSDLKGYIEQPSWYFENDTPEASRALDFLMMTQGWRRFRWETLLAYEFPEIKFFIEESLAITGKVNWASSEKPISGGTVTLFVQDSTGTFMVSETGDNGRFAFIGLDFKDSTDIVLQGENRKGKKRVDVLVDPPIARLSADATAAGLPLSLSPEMADYLAKAAERRRIERSYSTDGAMILDGVEIKAQRQEPDDGIDRVYDKGDVVIKVGENVDASGLVHPLQLLQGRAAGVQISGSGQFYRVIIRGLSSINSSTDPLILVDNIPVDLEFLASLPVNDVTLAEVFKDAASTAQFGVRGAGGVIAFYTKKGGGIVEARQGMANIKRRGYNQPREFYSPNYAVPSDAHRMPDKRATVYWLPNLQVDKSGKANIRFYTTDEQADVLIKAEGLSILGQMGVGSTTFSSR